MDTIERRSGTAKRTLILFAVGFGVGVLIALRGPEIGTIAGMVPW
jgi:uncharacterized membrane protein